MYHNPVRLISAFGCALLVLLVGAGATAQQDVQSEEVPQAGAAIGEVLVGPASEIPCRPEAIAGGIECVVADEAVFTRLHPSLYPQPRDYRQRGEGSLPVAPVQLDGLYYYGVNNDLLEFDGEHRQITDRVRFPAPIVDIVAGDSKLEVGVEAPPHRTDAELEVDGQRQTVAIDYRPGQSEIPGRGPWNWTGTLSALHDAMWLDDIELSHEPGGTGGDGVDEATNRAALAQLQRLQQVDPTNPYVPLFRGEILDRMDQPQRARQAFEEAASHQGADWIDGLRVGLRLQIRGYSKLADQAFDGSRAQMDEAGVRGEYVTALVNATFAFVWFQPAMSEAISAGDVQTADAMARQLDATFPKLEGAPFAWGRLAAFFDDQNAGERADFWRDRAGEIRGVERPDQIFEETARSVDLYLVLQIGLILTALFGGAILGLWRYEEDDESGGDEGRGEKEDERKDEQDAPEWKEYLPRFYHVDLVMIAGIFAVLVALPMMVAPQVQSMATLAQAPPAASGDALSAPAVSDWADDLSESSVREQLIEESQAELEATKSGSKGPGQADINQLLIDVVHADTEARGVRRLGDVDTSEAALQEFEWLQPLVELEFDARGLLLLLVVLGMNALILGSLLQAVARRFESVRRIGRAMVPGAPNSLRVLRIPTLGAFFVGLAMMTPLSGMVQAATEASLVAFFGLEQAPATGGGGLSTMGFALMTVALIVHAIGVVRDRQR